MTLQQFIQNFEAQFEEIEPNTISEDTPFRSLEEWSSMQALLVISMIDAEYGIAFSGEDMRACNTINDIFEIVKSRVQ